MSDLILGSVTDLLVVDTLLGRLVSEINIKEAEPRLISNVKVKEKMEHKRGTVNKVVANSSHSMVTLQYLSQTLNIGLDKLKQMLRVTIQRGIYTAVHPIRKRYIIDHLDPRRKYISGRWYVDWMPAATKAIT